MAVQGSRFFAGGDTSSSDESSSDEEIIQTKQVARPAFQWSDDDEDTKRVVRSEKEKRWEEMKGIIKTMKNHKNIKDIPSIQSDFEDLCRCYDKSKKVIEKEGIPRFFVRCMSELDTFINECWEDREWRKTLNKGKEKVLREVRQRLKRYLRDSANIEKAVNAFRENPDHGDDDEDDDEAPQDKSDDEVEPEPSAAIRQPQQEAPRPARAPARERHASDDDDSEVDFTSESEDSSSDDSDEPGIRYTRDYFLKDRPGDESKKVKKEKKVRPAPKKIAESEDEDDGKGPWTEVLPGGATLSVSERPKIFAKDVEITLKAVVDKLNEFVLGRGKKGTDRMLMVEQLVELRSIASEHKLGLALDMKILFGIIGAIYDYNPNIAACMKDDLWKKCVGYIQELLELMANNEAELQVVANQDAIESLEGEDLLVRGNVLHVVERLDEEYVKMLQACDAHSTEYVERLRDEPVICKVIEDLQTYLEKTRAMSNDLCRIYLKRIEHLYYKFDLKNQDANLKLMDSLCKYIYDNDNTDRVRTRAMLCQIYHLALHNQWFLARDLMLMSHLQENIQSADIPTQIMYNRSMVQLGLCAFRKGMIKDSHNCLVDIQSSGRAKELLAQGLLLQRQNERTAEQEKIEKRRQVPFHMHINLELIECVYLVSAMLIEIPYMAAHEFDARRRMISKNFHHVLRVSDRQPLLGPPESMREHLVAASKAMKSGNWRDCFNFVINEKMNAKVWDLFYDAESVRQQLSEKIKVESLRTYLFTYSSIYDSVSLVKLAQMHELPVSVVHSTVSKMIINEELAASMDEPSQCAIMHRTDPTRLQSLALQLSEKVQNLVDCNEKLWEMKSGNFSFQRQHNQGGPGRGGEYRQQRYKNYNQDSSNRRVHFD